MSHDTDMLRKQVGRFIADQLKFGHGIVAVLVWVLTMHIRETTAEQLKDYVPKTEFKSYTTDHERWETTVMANLTEAMTAIRQDIRELRAEVIKNRLVINPTPPPVIGKEPKL